jgi:uncharacterized membrane protein
MVVTTGPTYSWTLIRLSSLLSLVLGVTSDVVMSKLLGSRHWTESRQIRGDEPPGLQEAEDALWLRYACGEIGRRDYLQGKVELRD